MSRRYHLNPIRIEHRYSVIPHINISRFASPSELKKRWLEHFESPCGSKFFHHLLPLRMLGTKSVPLRQPKSKVNVLQHPVSLVTGVAIHGGITRVESHARIKKPRRTSRIVSLSH